MLRSTTRAVWLLVVLHVAAGLIAVTCFDVHHDAAEVIYFAIVLADAGLLGLLWGLAAQSLSIRSIESIVGLIYLWGLNSYAHQGDNTAICGLLAVTTVFVAVLFGVLRYRGLGLRQRDSSSRPGHSEPLRFGIRHLMAWIFATAAVVKIGQMLDPRGTLGTLFAYGLIFTAVTVAAPWAVLGSRRPLIRACLLILASAAIGVAGPIYQRSATDHELYMVAGITAGDVVIVLASLAFLRRAGLRLVRAETSALKAAATDAIESP